MAQGETQPCSNAVPEGRWEVDPTWSNIGYEVQHMGVVASRGWFRAFSGEINVADGSWSAHGSVDLGSLDTGDWARDEHVLGRLFLSFEDFPPLQFHTARFDVDANGRIELTGPLTLHGFTRLTSLYGSITGVHENRIGLAVSGEISRRAFGLRFARKLPDGTPVVGDAVKLILELTAVRSQPAPVVDGPVVAGRRILERVANPLFGAANTYLIADRDSRRAVMIDAGGPAAPLLSTIASEQLDLTHVLLTHHHLDHVVALAEVCGAHPDAQVLIHASERPRVGRATGTISHGATFTSGGLTIQTLATGGHTAGGLSYLVDERYVYAGDTLYRDTIATAEMSGHGRVDDLFAGIKQLVELPGETVVYSGHGEPTTVAREIDENPFVRVLLGLEPEGTEECSALGRRATLIALGTDGHGNSRAWIRWNGGTDDVVAGDILERD